MTGVTDNGGQHVTGNTNYAVSHTSVELMQEDEDVVINDDQRNGCTSVVYRIEKWCP